jgi:ribonuclease HI
MSARAKSSSWGDISFLIFFLKSSTAFSSPIPIEKLFLYADGSRRNIALKLENHRNNPASNSRAELSAILEALRQNEVDDLIIESDSLSSLRAICTDSVRYEDQGWYGIQNADLLKGILVRLRTRPAQTEFRWVKGHDEENYGNGRADALADTGREQNIPVALDDGEWLDGHPALQDGARLQVLEAMHTYEALLEWHTRKLPRILHQEKLDKAKDRVQETTGLRPTNEKLLKGIRALNVPPRIKDHMRCMLTGKIKCGTFWDKVPGHNERALCSFCKKKQNTDVIETEKHMWLDCENSGQAQVWNVSERTWRRSTDREWPTITLGLIRGAAALTFEEDFSKDSERLRISVDTRAWSGNRLVADQRIGGAPFPDRL